MPAKQDYPLPTKEILTTKELAQIMGCSQQTLYNQQCRGVPLPPRIKIPGIKGYRYLRKDIMSWIEGMKSVAYVSRAQTRSGRPRKAIAV